MPSVLKHISVCICTYKRPKLLNRLLLELANQTTAGAFTYAIVIVDNDRARSAESVITDFASRSDIPITYVVEPQQGICLARNKAIENSCGEFVAFIDDDEFPKNDWLLELFRSCTAEEVAGVLGPVVSHFDEQPPEWVIKGRFYERPTHPTGFVVPWEEGRTGNVLLKKELFTPGVPAFDPAYHRGGDTDFFRRMIEKGQVFIWCNEAIVYEVVPPARWTRSFMLNRALLRGSITCKSPTFGIWSIAKSIVAASLYIVALPFAAILGQHRFMDLLVRLFDHVGKLLASVGLNPVKSPYVTD